MDLGVKSTPFTSSNASWKSGADAVPGQFPAGLKVLVVDDDPTCLRILEKMLKNCLYEVTTCNRAEVALNFLRNNKNGCNVVISDVHMPDMDGFKLLEHVGLEMDLPVIMMSADDSKHVVMKGITHGACDYLIKPVRIEALKNIWQHVVRKKKHEWSEKDLEHLGSVEEGEWQQKLQEDVDCSSSVNEGNWKQSKKRKEEEDEAEDRDDTSALKKPRVVWSVELHQQFVAAVNQLGIDKAVPKKILESMNIPGLTRENVASHLQKYRLYLRRLSGVSQHHYGLGSSFMGPTDVQFGPMSSLNGVDLQALAASGQIPHQSLASIQAAALGRATSKSAVPLPLVDQRNIFNFENPKMRFVEGQNESSKQVNLLHGFPTNMDSKQLASLHQSTLGNMNMHVHSQTSQSGSMLMQMAQLKPQSSTQILNDINGSRNAIENENGCGQQYTSIPKQSNSANLSSDSTSFSGNITFPPSSNSRVSSAEMKGSRGFLPNYDVLNNVNQNRNHEWHLQNVGSRSGPPRHLNIQGEPSANKAALSPAGGHGNPPNIAHFPATDKSLRSKAERLPGMGFQNGLLHERFGQEDLMSALLKQQQEGVVVPVETETEFGFDGY